MDQFAIILLFLGLFNVALISEVGSETVNGQFVILDIISEEKSREALQQNVTRAGRIVMGSYATANQFPYYGYAILYRTASSTFCGSSLISSEWLVTAAHCMKDVTSGAVYFGSIDRDIMKISRNINGYIIHELFDNPTPFANDIALLKLTSAVPFSTSIASVQLPARSDKANVYSGVSLTSCGFGKANDGYPRYLQYTTITGMSNAECLKNHWVFLDSMLCGKDFRVVGSSVCFGDSGSIKLLSR